MKKLLKKLKNAAGKCWEAIKKGCKWIVDELKAAAEWCVENQEVVYVISGIMTIGWSMIKKFRKTNTQREQEFQRKHIYDRSIGHHWELKRGLTRYEMWEIDRWRRDGETLGEILQTMRVLA